MPNDNQQQDAGCPPAPSAALPGSDDQPLTIAERHALESLEELEPGGRRLSKRVLALQAAGGLLGLSIFAAAIYYATSGENAQALTQLRDAPAHLIALLALLSLATITTWGALFTFSIRPLHTIPLLRTIAVNAVATFIAAVPFKLSLAFRGLIHHKRDNIPIRDCLAWLAALSGLTVIVMLGLAGVALLTKQANTTFYIAATLWIITAHAAALILSRIIEASAANAEAQGTTNTARWIRRLTLGVTRINQDPKQIIATGTLRVVEIAITALRFTVAARMVGLDLDPGSALILALAFSVISILAPTGTLGLREGATALIGTTTGLTAESAALIALLVSAAELLTALALAIPATIWLKPWRLVTNNK